MFLNLFKEFCYKNKKKYKKKYYLFYNNLDYKLKGKYYIHNNIIYTCKSINLIDKKTLVGIIYL